ncbi:MAG: TIGR03936 family radical SAM-associated protein [Streptosporangiaceae bacterium]
MARRAPAGPPPAPVAQRLVIRYAKRGRMRFASSRDIARCVERAVRAAGLPIGYSAGFSPHPRISYAGGAQTGTASEAEYLELALTGQCAASDVRDRLDAALPSGIDVIDVFELTSAPLAGQAGASGEPAAPRAAALSAAALSAVAQSAAAQSAAAQSAAALSAVAGQAAGAGPPAGRLDALRLEASEWEVVLPGVAPADAERAVETFLAARTVVVERLTSKGTRPVDARAAVVTMQAGGHADVGRDAACAILRMVVRHLTPAVRPDDILTALRQLAALAPSSPPLVTRLAQGPLGMEAAAAAAPAPGLTGPAGSPAPDGAAADASAPSGRQRMAQQQEKTTRPGAGPAETAGPAPVSAYDQLPRGAEGPETALRAREPDGRLPECSRSSHRIEETTVMTGLRPPASPLI